MTGNRRGRNRGAGWDFAHLAADDATRLACVDVLGDERKTTTTAFLLRALRWFGAHGIRAERVMTGNPSAFRSCRFAKALRWPGIRRIFTRPYTPKTNAKTSPPRRPRTGGGALLDILTLLREWAYGLAHPSSNARNDDLPRWLDWFNSVRPNSALNGISPAQRMNDLMRTRS